MRSLGFSSIGGKGMYRRYSWAFLIIFSTLLIQCLAVGLQRPYRPEMWEYEVAAQNFLNGRGLTVHYLGTDYRALLHPFYPLLCVGIYWLFGSLPVAVAYTQIIIFGLVACISYRIGKEVFCEKTATLAALLVCLHPGLFIYTTHKLHSLIVDTFWFLRFLLFTLKLQKKMNFKRAVFAGIILGFAILSRPTILLFSGVASIWLLKQWDFLVRKKFLFLFTLLATTAVILTPWAVRNFIVFGRFIPMSTSSGIHLWRGNNPNATGTLRTSSGEIVLYKDVKFLEELYKLDELGQAQLFQKAALTYMREHPWRTFQLFLKKFYYFWWFSPQSGILYPPKWRLLYRGWYSSAILLAILGMECGWRKTACAEQREKLLLLILFLFSISLFQSIFFVEGRHRWTIEPVLLIFSAEGLRFLMEDIWKYCRLSETRS